MSGKLNEEVKEQIIIKLGGPIRQVELTTEHFDTAYTDALESFDLYSSAQESIIPNEVKSIWVNKYTLANCKEYLGRVRGKFGGIIEGVDIKLSDHETLIAESQKEKEFLIGRLMNFKNSMCGLIPNPKSNRNYEKDREQCFLGNEGDYFTMMCFYWDGEFFDRKLESVVKTFKKEDYDIIHSSLSSILNINEFNKTIESLGYG